MSPLEASILGGAGAILLATAVSCYLLWLGIGTGDQPADARLVLRSPTPDGAWGECVVTNPSPWPVLVTARWAQIPLVDLLAMAGGAPLSVRVRRRGARGGIAPTSSALLGVVPERTRQRWALPARPGAVARPRLRTCLQVRIHYRDCRVRTYTVAERPRRDSAPPVARPGPSRPGA